MYDGFGYLGLDTSEEVRQQLIDEEEAEDNLTDEQKSALARLEYFENLTVEDYKELKDGVEDYDDISEDGFIKYSEDCYTDEVGGHHDSGIGWAPNDQWCGECTKGSCSKCPVWKAIKTEIESELNI